MGWGPGPAQGKALLVLGGLTDLQGTDDATDVLFWNQRVVKLEGTDVVGRNVGRSQGLGDLGHDAALIIFHSSRDALVNSKLPGNLCCV